ncbi:unnamed protein product [Phytomonas sp. Hart1]|nr:unnamed protein product [Phytomonas sp. Hart1]|eukprot:CCW71376.1 unnamed protein product [Phytomonas sp. isolate Hart1]
METHPSPFSHDEGYQSHVEHFPYAQITKEMAHVSNPESSLEKILMALPKLDLHFHLNGSISPVILAHMKRLSTLSYNKINSENVVDLNGGAIQDEPPSWGNSAPELSSVAPSMPNSSSLPMGYAGLNANKLNRMNPKDRMLTCFKMFDEVYSIMTNLAFTRLAVQDILWHCAAENVLVVEIRTSLRDKLRWGIFQQNPAETREAKTENPEQEPSKEDYLWTVIDTVEHLLQGGVVDFQTGELFPYLTQSDILDYASSPGGAATTDGPRARWWSFFKALYGGLPYAPVRPSRPGVRQTPMDGDSAVGLFDHLHHALCDRLHVRLLVSMNRGGRPRGPGRRSTSRPASNTRSFAAFTDGSPTPRALLRIGGIRGIIGDITRKRRRSVTGRTEVVWKRRIRRRRPCRARGRGPFQRRRRGPRGPGLC